ERFESLLIRFGFHYEGLAVNNPLKTLCTAADRFEIQFTRLSLITKGIHMNPRYLNLVEDIPLERSSRKELLEKKLFELRKDLFSKTKTVTDRIGKILPESRHPSNYTDISLNLSNRFMAMYAIKYRMSLLFINITCPVCLKLFKHTHISRCLGLNDTDELFTFKKQTRLAERIMEINTINKNTRKSHTVETKTRKATDFQTNYNDEIELVEMESSLNKINKLPTTHITAVKETNDMDIEDENQTNIKTSFKDNETNITPKTCSKSNKKLNITNAEYQQINNNERL
ncbi:hypothetical protein BB558_002270, partial [Smittium angustum]